jgi:hypothetical protein
VTGRRRPQGWWWQHSCHSQVFQCPSGAIFALYVLLQEDALWAPSALGPLTCMWVEIVGSPAAHLERKEGGRSGGVYHQASFLLHGSWQGPD